MVPLLARSKKWFSTRRQPKSRPSPVRPSFRPQLEALEDRRVPAVIDPLTALANGDVTVSRPPGESALPGSANFPFAQPFGLDAAGDVCITFSLTPAGIAAVAHGDTIQVGLVSADLVNPQLNVFQQQVNRNMVGTLSSTNTSATFCVELDDVLCDQIDAYVGTLDLLTRTSGATNLAAAVLHPTSTATGVVHTVETTDLNLSQTLIQQECSPGFVGNDGLTIGYWKTHQQNWQVYSPSQTLGSVFGGLDTNPAYASLENLTLAQALSLSGGPSLTDKAGLMLKQAVGALLNAANSNVGYSLTTAQIKAEVNDALASVDPNVILNLQNVLDALNSVDQTLNPSFH